MIEVAPLLDHRCADVEGVCVYVSKVRSLFAEDTSCPAARDVLADMSHSSMVGDPGLRRIGRTFLLAGAG
jgi:hypothetical protein